MNEKEKEEILKQQLKNSLKLQIPYDHNKILISPPR